MPRLFRKIKNQAGAPPGTLIHIGEKKIEHVRLTVVNYNEETMEEHSLSKVQEALNACDDPRWTWLNVDGLHDTDLISAIGQHLHIHPLTLEDILNTNQRPKTEDYTDYIYIVLKMLRYIPDQRSLISEQVSLVITPRVLVSFQESEGDVFKPVRERLHKGKGHIRSAGSAYLAYALMDAIVDHYFIILEQIGEEIENLEDRTFSEPGPDCLQRLHELKRQVLNLRKEIWPLREMVVLLIREDAKLIDPVTIVFLRDVYDHSIQVIDTIESYRDLLSSLLDLYVSTISNRTNEIMKVLTVIATIFIPLTFIAGVYGMNFKYMPELEWPWGYPVIWAVMVLVAAVMLSYFKRKDWI